MRMLFRAPSVLLLALVMVLSVSSSADAGWLFKGRFRGHSSGSCSSGSCSPATAAYPQPTQIVYPSATVVTYPRVAGPAIPAANGPVVSTPIYSPSCPNGRCPAR